MKKILVIRFSSIGDIVLTTPVVRCLKKQIPGAEIHYLTKPQYKAILEHNPYIDHLHVLDKPLLQKASELRKLGFDDVIDLHNNLRTSVIKAVLNTSAHSFDKLNFEKWLLVNFKINKLPPLHIVDRCMQTVEHLGVKNDGQGLDYFLPPNLDLGSISLPENYVAFAIGGQHNTKKLPVEKIISICRLIEKPIVLLGGKEDSERGQAIESAVGLNVTNLCGKLSLHQSAWVIQQCSKVITHDTGMMHVAAAFKKDIVSVWGNTVPEFGMTPYYGHADVRGQRLEVRVPRTANPTATPPDSAGIVASDKDSVPFLDYSLPDVYASELHTYKKNGEPVIRNYGSYKVAEVLQLDCRPCSKLGYDACPKGHFKCMKMQDERAIAQAVQ